MQKIFIENKYILFFFRLILFPFMKYKKVNVEQKIKPDESGIVIAFPHTSNWDLIYGLWYVIDNRFKTYFLIKKEWIDGPFGRLLKYLGGITVDRKNKSNNVEVIARLIKENKNFYVTITPEGTRGPVDSWKKGFYYIAKKANCPIYFAELNYETMEFKITRKIFISGDESKDFKMFYNLSQKIMGKNVENQFPKFKKINNKKS